MLTKKPPINDIFNDPMYLSTENKKKLFGDHSLQKNAAETGSPESQIALFTYRINHLTEHLSGQKKDFSARMGLLQLVGKRRKLLNYLQKKNIDRYRSILVDLKLRK